jgi:hypothetical protein
MANPHLLQSDAIWTELVNRTPAFSQTMLDEMWSGLANTSPIQLLLAQMGSAQRKVLAIGTNGLRAIGANPSTWQNNLDTAQMICNALPNPYFKFLSLLHQKGLNQSLSLEDSIDSFLQAPAISDIDFHYFDELSTLYKHFYSAKQSPEGLGLGLAAIPQEVVTIMENSSLLSMRSLASSMLLQEHDENFLELGTTPSSITHFDIVLPETGASNKKGQRNIPVEVIATNSLHVYPNPARDVVNLEVVWPKSVASVTVQIQSAEGRVVLQKAFTTNAVISNLPLSVASLPKGVYVVSVSNDSGVTLQQKLVVQ